MYRAAPEARVKISIIEHFFVCFLLFVRTLDHSCQQMCLECSNMERIFFKQWASSMVWLKIGFYLYTYQFCCDIALTDIVDIVKVNIL